MNSTQAIINSANKVSNIASNTALKNVQMANTIVQENEQVANALVKSANEIVNKVNTVNGATAALEVITSNKTPDVKINSLNGMVQNKGAAQVLNAVAKNMGSAEIAAAKTVEKIVNSTVKAVNRVNAYTSSKLYAKVNGSAPPVGVQYAQANKSVNNLQKRMFTVNGKVANAKSMAAKPPTSRAAFTPNPVKGKRIFLATGNNKQIHKNKSGQYVNNNGFKHYLFSGQMV